MASHRVKFANEAAAEMLNGIAPCPACFESCGYVVEHGNDWSSGPWTNQTNIPCKHCGGTGYVEMEDATDDELFEHFDDAFDALTFAA